MEFYYKQPKYYSSFHCIGGECSLSCCNEWGVDWYIHELEKLKSAEMSDELREKVEKNFEHNEERDSWVIKLCEDKRCPFHNRETDLCDIQKELGAEYLGDTCTNYPRVFFVRGKDITRTINSSCPAVLDILVNDKNAVVMETMAARNGEDLLLSVRWTGDKKEAALTSPYLLARPQITDFILKILQGNRSLESSMILAAMAAKKISDASDRNDMNEIKNVIQSYRKQAAQASAGRAADGIEPNYKLKFIIVNNLIVKYFGGQESGVNISVLHDGENVILANYERGKEEFDKAFAGRDYAIRNIAENMFLDVFYHLNLTKGTFFEMFAYFTACVAAIQVFARAIGFASRHIEKDYIRAVAHLNRAMSHNRKNAEKVVNEMRALGMTTPAHLALIIK